MAGPQIQSIDTEYKPWGGLAGIMTGEREAMQRAANLQGLEESQLGNIIKQIQASRELADYHDPRMEMLRQQGIMGKNQSDMAKGYTDVGTMESGVVAGNAKNRASASGSDIDNMINTLDLAVTGLESNMYGPATPQAIMSQLPPQLQQVVQQHGPQGLVKLSELLKQQRINSPKYLGEQELQNQKYTMESDIASRKSAADAARNAATNSTNLELERMRIDAGKYNKASTAKTVDQLLLQAKSPTQKAEILEQAYSVAVNNGDVEGAAEYQRRALEARQRAAEDNAARAAATNSVKIDLNQYGVKTNQPNAPAPIAGSKPAQQAAPKQYNYVPGKGLVPVSP